MRVIAGSLGGRNFNASHGFRTHPMSEKMRGALFNALGDISGMTVLDAFAGTGALSIESISRGAASAMAIELDGEAFNTVLQNIAVLELTDKMQALRKNISGWSRNHKELQYDIVLCDPPYNDIRPNVLQYLAENVKTSGVYVLSWPGKEPIREFKGLSLLSNSSYGDSQLVFYRKD
jgi:16S rRNA (guanine966-N2)-methyltransferase